MSDLRAGGWQVVAASDVPTALAVARREAPDVIVASDRLAGGGGPTLVTRLRGLITSALTPIVALASDPSAEAVMRSVGATDSIPSCYQLVQNQKSAGSGRTIHLDQRTTARLERHRAWQNEIREMIGPSWQDRGLVFARPDGRWERPDSVTQAFRRAVRRVDVPYIRFHDLRHTHATLLLRAGVNAKVVSERLGHSSVSFTLDTYAHVLPGMQSQAAEQFSELVFGSEDEEDGDTGHGENDDPKAGSDNPESSEEEIP